MANKLVAKALIQIQQPISKVYHAIVEPEEMKHYFIANSTGKLENDTVVEWQFPEFADRFPVKGLIMEEPTFISFDWSGGQENAEVRIFLTEQKDGSTVVKIEEHEMENTAEGIKQLMQQTEGWANFLACLKAYLDHGINLRKGAFDFMADNH